MNDPKLPFTGNQMIARSRKFDPIRTVKGFFGDDYVPERDGNRLGRQLQAVFDAMSGGLWMTVEEVWRIVIDANPDAKWKVTSIDRQMRYLRDVEGCNLERKSEGGGMYRYRLVREMAMIWEPSDD